MTTKTKFKDTEIGRIPQEWNKGIFSQYINVNPQRTIKKGFVSKFVAMDNLKEHNKKIQGFTERGFKGGAKFVNGDTLMARITPCLENGKTAFVDILDKNEVGAGSTEFIVLSGKAGVTNNEYVYYLSVSPEVRENAIKSMVGTSGRQRVQNDVFNRLEIFLPRIEEQSSIAKILSDLDAKIELNQEMNKTLEAIGQALFKHWFVDFEFPCLPPGYMPFGAGKPILPPGYMPFGAGKPILPPGYMPFGAGKPILPPGYMPFGAGKPILPPGYMPFGAGKPIPADGVDKPDNMEKVCTYKAVGGLPAPEPGKYFIYVLLCKDESFYIGITDDLYRRWYEHKIGRGAKWTKVNEPVKVIHCEEFKSRNETAERERWLKSGFGRKWIKREYDKYLRKKAGLPAPECHLRQAGKMVDSELGEIPEGWKVGDLIDITEIVMGQSPPGESYNETGDGMPFYQGNRDFGFRYPSNRVFCDAPTRIAKEGDVLLSVRAPVGELNIAVEECAIGRGVCAIRMRNFSNSFLLYFLKLKTDLWNNFNSEGTVFGCLNKTELHKIKIVVPLAACLKAYDKIVVPIENHILNNEMQNRQLSQIRDSLLPRLMSGKIRVKVKP